MTQTPIFDDIDEMRVQAALWTQQANKLPKADPRRIALERRASEFLERVVELSHSNEP